MLFRCAAFCFSLLILILLGDADDEVVKVMWCGEWRYDDMVSLFQSVLAGDETAERRL